MVDGAGLTVNPTNVVSALTTEQVGTIYAAEITNWSEPAVKPATYGRPSARAGAPPGPASKPLFGGKPTYGKNGIAPTTRTVTKPAVRRS
jgi:hypothetical protein